MLNRVVVTGLGAVTPLGNDINTFWANAIAGVSGAARITRFDPSNFRTQFACEVKGFDPSLFMDRNDLKRTDLLRNMLLPLQMKPLKIQALILRKWIRLMWV